MSQFPEESTEAAINLIEPEDGVLTGPLQRSSIDSGDPQLNRLSVEFQLSEDEREWLWERAKSIPREITFSWNPRMDALDSGVKYDLVVALDPEFEEKRVFSGLEVTQVPLTNLRVGTTYYWRVLARFRGGLVGSSPVQSFITCSCIPRWILAPGVSNMRDMGGWPLKGGKRIRQGRIYRSAGMTGIRPRGRRVLLNDLGLRTDLNLIRGGEPTLDQDELTWINTPVRGYRKGIFEVSDDDGTWEVSYIRPFRVLASPKNYPLVFHCAAGKDRAGTVAFLLGALLGMKLEDLKRDYELSSYSGSERSADGRNFQNLIRGVKSCASNESSLQEAVEHYLLTGGLTPQEIATIRRLLVVDEDT